MARLSVVVPFFNVEAYIGEALESIARQTLHDIEVIMVDDGSTDGSAIIAKSFAARDARFRLVQQPNRGLGPARNTGVREASAPYLAFADSDDLVDPHAYELLVGSLDETGSDIACGGVRRLNRFGPGISWLHEEPFRRTIRRTHVSRYPVLLQDRTAWNKVFRRSFWDAHNLKFPGTLYEDGPVMIRAHVVASAVDVFRDIVYYWRLRDAGGLSITQRARDLSNVEDRMTSVRGVGSFLAATAPELKPIYDQSVLGVDIAMLISAYGVASEPERVRLAELGREYLSTVDGSVYPKLPAGKRLNAYLLSKGMLAELLEVLRLWQRGDGPDASIVRGESDQSRWYVSYPFFRDPAHNVPDWVYEITGEMTLNARLDKVEWRGKRLRIEGHAYIRWLNFAGPGDCRIRVSLHNSKTRRTIRLRPQPMRRPDVTARSNQAGVSYDGSGFAVEVSTWRLATAPGLWRAANWELRVEVSGSGLRCEGPVSSVAYGSAMWPEGRWITPTVWLQPAADYDGRFYVRGRRVSALVTGCRSSGDGLELEGWTTAKLTAGAALVISPRKGGATPIRVAVHTSEQPGPGRRRGRSGFRAVLPADQVVSRAEGARGLNRDLHVHDEITWDLSLFSGRGAPMRLTIAPHAAGARACADGRQITAFVTHFGYLSALERTVRPVVTQIEWTDDHRLILRGDYPDAGRRPAQLWLRHDESGNQHAIPLTWRDGAFSGELAPGRMPGLAGDLPLASGNWNLLASGPDGEITVAVARILLPGLPGYHPAGAQEVELQPHRTDALRLNVRAALADDERGRYAQLQLKRRHYPQAAARPLQDLVVADSFDGLQYSCNPRAIHEELRRSHLELECVWVTRGGQFSIPDDGSRLLLHGSRAHYEALARARFIVTNNLLPTWYTKREGQLCLQTWHGTPLKRIGLEIGRPKFSNALVYPDLIRRNVAVWDVLLSPNKFSTPIFRRAFDFGGEILESGYPRNDLLHRADRAQRAAAVREQLGLPAGKQVVLYAPTWRDDAFQQNGKYRFELQLDLPALSRALGEDHIVLLRLHSNVRNSELGQQLGGCVIDVTRYPDIADLYLVTDVLITDYSSAMFDFAGTGRPMLFFTYDLERYRDELRGFYFDFEAEAPGPLLSTSAEVIDALRNIDQAMRGYQQAYRDFVAKFCALDDGQAAERVVARMLAGPVSASGAIA